MSKQLFVIFVFSRQIVAQFRQGQPRREITNKRSMRNIRFLSNTWLHLGHDRR